MRDSGPKLSDQPLFVPVLAVAIVLPSVIYLAARLLIPGDGTSFDLQTSAPGRSGLFVMGKESTDLVLSIQDRSVDELLEQAFKFEGFRPYHRQGAVLGYRFADQGDVEVVFVQPIASDLFRGNWPSYLFLLYLLGIAVFAYVKRPDLPSTRGLLLVASSIFGSGLVFFMGLQPSDLLLGWPVWIYLWCTLILYGLFLAAGVHLFLIFPKKRDVLARQPAVLWLVYLGVLLLFVPTYLLFPIEGASSSQQLVFALRATGSVTAGYMLIGLLILVYGYLRSFGEAERRQVRWLLWAEAIVIVPWIALSILPPLLGLRPPLPQFVVGLIWLLLPTALAIAILRERLFDIDVIINRTLVYGVLTITLVIVYLASVALLQALYRELTGQDTPLVIVLSTLAIAAIFSPVRSHIQAFIDRRFYRRKYDAARTLANFSELARD